MNKNSDIDIAFLSDKEFETYELYIMSQELADIVGRDVDLVNLRKASTVFKAQIIGTGKEIYNSEPQKSAFFKMRVLKEYAMLNEERQCILDKVRQRGQIYVH